MLRRLVPPSKRRKALQCVTVVAVGLTACLVAWLVACLLAPFFNETQLGTFISAYVGGCYDKSALTGYTPEIVEGWLALPWGASPSLSLSFSTEVKRAFGKRMGLV
ncbi:hypothetical protein HZH66_013298 [Vespula vulgaris]|uniref:Uncharacterized protein n=1 Tax=Vespula vulgaris TaxID=7454 RepID=A0A834J6M9_VESVU|nr:hypothetical protein HZH66_013298 [Vespula vulgaris]